MKKITLMTGKKPERIVSVHYVGAFNADGFETAGDKTLCEESYTPHRKEFGEPLLTRNRVDCTNCRQIKNHVLGVAK